MRILPINIDSDNKQTALCAAVGDFGTPADIGQFALGDKEEFEIYFFGSNELGEWFGAPETRIEVGLGEIAIPGSGTFNLKITSAQGPQVLSDIDIAISAQELEDKLNALPNVSSAGGLDVQGTNPFIITARTADANFEIEADVINLNPISGALIQSQEVDGRQVITLSIRTALCAYSDDFVFAEDGEVYRGSLSLLTRELRAALGDSEQKRFAFEISIIKPDGSRTTAYQTRINVINKLIDDAAFGAVALPIFLTKAQADASYAPISAVPEVATLRDDLSELSDDFTESKSSVEAELAELHSRKSNVGEHLFNSGKIVGDISFPNFPFSICITYELDNFSTEASQVLFQAVAANGQ